MYRRLESSFVVLLFVALAATAQAQPSANAGKPYEIQADSAVFDQKQGWGKYRGHVQLSRGSEQLTASRVTLYLSEDKQLKRVEAKGSPVTFTDGAGMSGHADRLKYNIATQTIYLLGDAYVEQQGRRFSGGKITYSLRNERVQAEGGDDERVRLVLPPSDTQSVTEGNP